VSSHFRVPSFNHLTTCSGLERSLVAIELAALLAGPLRLCARKLAVAVVLASRGPLAGNADGRGANLVLDRVEIQVTDVLVRLSRPSAQGAGSSSDSGPERPGAALAVQLSVHLSNRAERVCCAAWPHLAHPEALASIGDAGHGIGDEKLELQESLIARQFSRHSHSHLRVPVCHPHCGRASSDPPARLPTFNLHTRHSLLFPILQRRTAKTDVFAAACKGR